MNENKDNIEEQEEVIPEVIDVEELPKEEPKAKTEKPKKKKAKQDDALDKALAELMDEKNKYLRLAAEYDNFRKRSQKERESLYTDVRGDTVTKFLPVYDNLERALKQETSDEEYKKGVQLIMTQFEELMTNLGVAVIDAKANEPFNPDFHNAVMHVDDENLGENVVAEEFQKGFRLGDKVIRFSVVKVAN